MLLTRSCPLAALLLLHTLPLAGSVPDPDGGGLCSSVADCNWGGACQSGACVCDPTWTGPHCAALHLLPASPTAVYPPDANTEAQSTWTWGAAAVSGDDGRVHLYVTEWMNNCPMTYPSFLTQTQIVHVVGETADGPFVRVEGESVVPVAAGNPVPAQAPDGTHLLYFTNYRFDGAVQNCSAPDTTTARPLDEAAAPVNNACGIHLARAKSLDGPWEIIYDIAYGEGGSRHWDNCTLTNPGPFVFKNGTVLMMFKLCRCPSLPPPLRHRLSLVDSMLRRPPRLPKPPLHHGPADLAAGALYQATVAGADHAAAAASAAD